MKALLSILSILILSNGAYAFDLHKARKSKKVVELSTGFLKANDPATEADVKTINLKRKKAYQKIYDKLKPEEKKKLTVEDIGKKAAKKIKKSMDK